MSSTRRRKQKDTKPKKVGRGFIRDRKHLTPREEHYCQLIAAGLPMESACEEINVSIKEASRWHAEHPLLEKRISEIRGERYDELTESTIEMHFKLLSNLNDQIKKKLEMEEPLSVKELKEAYELSQCRSSNGCGQIRYEI